MTSGHTTIESALKEQIHFAPGSSFWVVAKFPAGAKNPLAAGKTNQNRCCTVQLLQL